MIGVCGVAHGTGGATRYSMIGVIGVIGRCVQKRGENLDTRGVRCGHAGAAENLLGTARATAHQGVQRAARRSTRKTPPADHLSGVDSAR